MHRFPALVLAAVATTAMAHAQTPNHLVGITRVTPVLHHHDQVNCVPLGSCPPVGFPNAVALPPYAGGTGWDPTTRGAWITNGQWLAEVDRGCNYLCPPMPIPFPVIVPPPPVPPVATGLEVVESQNQLFMIDSLGFLSQFRLACPPVMVARCNTGLVPVGGQVTSGLAVDEGLGLLFYAYPDFATGVNTIAVARLANPCQILQRLQVAGCTTLPVLFGPITGLAVDWCTRTLYATDGLTFMAIRYVPALPAVAFTAFNCCFSPIAIPDPLIGLAVMPGGATSFGVPCNNGTCPACPMSHGLVNDPNIGNFQFALDLTGAPAGSLAWDLIGIGPCGPGPFIPPLCGPIHIGAHLGTLGPVPTGGFAVCGGAATFGLPLPVIPALCGTIVSSQCAVLCVAGGVIGTSLSNCLTFELQGN